MSASKFDPMNPATEIDHKGIIKLTGVSETKIINLALTNKNGFPSSTRQGPRGKKLYCLMTVTRWLESNDIKKISRSASECDRKKGINTAEIMQLKIGIKPTRFKGGGKTVTVHLAELNDYEHPHPLLTRFSNSGADHHFNYFKELA